MADAIRLLAPSQIDKNPENPRLIFRESELAELQDSIAAQGVLVPLTVYDSGSRFVILDGERRWRCALRLNLARLPVIVQPEPTQLQNIMMMFAIHHTRKEWDPLPTAKKLQQLEEIFFSDEGRLPNEPELAQLASMTRGEVRRLKNMLALPPAYIEELMGEAEKPRSAQTLTVDHVLEATRGALALVKRGVLDGGAGEALTDAIIQKYRSGVIKNTVEPRQLARMARAVERQEMSPASARRVVSRLIEDRSYSVEKAFQDSVARVDAEHGLEQLADRLRARLEDVANEEQPIGERLEQSLNSLMTILHSLLRS